MRKYVFFATIIFTQLAYAQVFYATDFESQAVGVAYTRPVWQADGFQTATWDNGLATRTSIDNSTSVSGTKSLRVTYPAGEFGTNGTGCQIPLQFTPQDEVYMSYWLKFSDNFSWGTTSEGGKLPGFAGGGRCSGCSHCDGTNGFSARLMWRQGGRAVLYLYHMDKANNCGDDIQLVYPWGDNVVFEKGKWYHVMQRVKINTDGSASAYDGEVELWVNGYQVLSISGYRFTANGDKVDNLYFSTFHGGASTAWAPTETCYTWFDDIRISSNAADVSMQSCQGPNLGSNTSLCGVSSVTLDANVPEDNATFQWVKDNATMGTNSSITVSDPGTYVLIYDSLGCVRRDTIIVNSSLQPNLGSNREICATSFEILDAQDQGVGYTYAWTKDGDSIEGAMSRTFAAYQPGTYRVTISATGCSDAFDEVTLTSGFLTVPNVIGAPSSEVTLTVQNQGENYAWYTSADAETVLFTGKSYTTTVGSESRFVYVEDAGGFTGLIGKKNSGVTFTDDRFDRRMRFEVFRNLTVDSITIYAVAEQDVTIRILGSDQTTVIHTITHTNIPAGENRIFIGSHLEPGLYYMDAMGSTGRLLYSNQNDPDISFPYTINGIISILGSNLAWIDNYPYYLFFYNWRVSTGNTCARTPVFIEAEPVEQTPDILKLEAEDASYTGATFVTNPAGYSGTGAVYLQTGSITFTLSVPEAGAYSLHMRVATTNGHKDQDLYVNGSYGSKLIFPANNQYFDFYAGSIILNQGTNTIMIDADWGYMTFDYITLESAEPIDYSLADVNLINLNSDQKTRDLYAYLRSQYGTNIISGQTAYWDELRAVAEKTPKLRAFDFQSYTVGYPYLWDNGVGGHTFGWIDRGVTQEAIDWYYATNQEGIVSFQWHWHSPWGGAVSTNTFYTQYTNFNASLAIVPGNPEYTAIIRDIDSIASQLKRLEHAGVPVLWRPLHEAGGEWFWWGAQGAAVCMELYDILFDRLTNYHNLNNLIWVWSTPEPAWYPGNDKVDIIGYDSYPGAFNYTTQKGMFDQLYAIVEGRKMIAMSENGPIPHIDDCIDQSAMWLYFSSWDNLVVAQNSTEHIQYVYSHPNVITLDDTLPVEITQTITLEQGWNLISVSVLCTDVPSGTDVACNVSTVFENLDVEIVKNADGFWKPDHAHEFNSLHTLETGKGYLVYMNTAGTIEITGMIVQTPNLGVSMGWQLIGYPCCKAAWPCVSTPISNYFDATNCQQIKNFDGFWEPNEPLNSIQNFEPGKGYFLKK